MRNLLFNISYNGARYHGYQVQANALSVAEVLQNAVEEVLHVREPIVGCSRTDTGVHANSYFFNMKTTCAIPPERMVVALNRALPMDIAVNACREVPLDFHARYHCTGKEYLYKLWNSPVKNPFLENLVCNYRYPVEEEKLHAAAQAFVGTHDFRSFCALGGKEMETTRTIHRFSVTRQGDLVLFRVAGDGFLYNMVRIMVGTLLTVQEGRLTAQDLLPILAAKDRRAAGKTARAEGLYLNRVYYGGETIEQLNIHAE